MKKRFLAALLSLCMTLTLLPTTAFAALSDLLGNTPKENQAILEQLSALTGGSSDQVRSVLNALGLLDEDGNFKVDQTITLDGQVLTLAAVMELLENVGSYVLVGVICFIAAVVVTVFCTRLRKKNNKQEEQTKEDEET